MSALGHVSTAPWQEHSDGTAALVGCGHVSGLLVRPGWPLALMFWADRVPIESTHSKMLWPKRVLPTLGTTVSALRRHALANSFKIPNAVPSPGLTSLNRSGFDATSP